MKCPKCQADNVNTARFCASCGSPLSPPAAAPRPGTAARIRCSGCGATNPPGSTFCENCGKRLTTPAARHPTPAPVSRPASPTPATQTTAATQPVKKPTSAAWWLLPIVLAWIGGLIGFLVVRDSDKGKANGLLILGIVMTFAWPLLWTAIAAALNASFFDF